LDRAVASPEPAQESTQPKEPAAPVAGERLRFLESDWYIQACEPDRPNLPVVFELRSAAGLTRRANFETVMGLLRKQVGDDVGAWVIEAPQSAPGSHFSSAEQTVHHMALPGVQHSYSHRKRR
jgi:hypothetical protein